MCRLAERACLLLASAVGETASGGGRAFCFCSRSEVGVNWGSQSEGEELSFSGLCCRLVVLSVRGMRLEADWKPYSISIGTVLGAFPYNEAFSVRVLMPSSSLLLVCWAGGTQAD